MARSPVNKSPQLARGFNQPRHIYDLAASVERELRDHATGIDQSIRPASPLLLPTLNAIPVGDGVQFVNGLLKGTWTPEFGFSTTLGNFTHTGHILGSPEAHFVRLGPLVFYSVNLSVGGMTHSTASGLFRVTGLPYTSSDGHLQQRASTIAYEGFNLDAGRTELSPYVPENTAFIEFNQSGDSAGVNVITEAHIISGGNLVILTSGWYMTDAAL